MAVDQATSFVKTSRGVPLGNAPAPCLRLARAQPWLPMGKEGCQGAAVSSGESCPVPGLPDVPVAPLQPGALSAARPRQLAPGRVLPCLLLLWLAVFCTRARIRQDDAKGFSDHPQKAHNPTFHLFPSTLLSCYLWSKEERRGSDKALADRRALQASSSPRQAGFVISSVKTLLCFSVLFFSCCLVVSIPPPLLFFFFFFFPRSSSSRNLNIPFGTRINFHIVTHNKLFPTASSSKPKIAVSNRPFVSG